MAGFLDRNRKLLAEINARPTGARNPRGEPLNSRISSNSVHSTPNEVAAARAGGPLSRTVPVDLTGPELDHFIANLKYSRLSTAPNLAGAPPALARVTSTARPASAPTPAPVPSPLSGRARVGAISVPVEAARRKLQLARNRVLGGLLVAWLLTNLFLFSRFFF